MTTLAEAIRLVAEHPGDLRAAGAYLEVSKAFEVWRGNGATRGARGGSEQEDPVVPRPDGIRASTVAGDAGRRVPRRRSPLEGGSMIVRLVDCSDCGKRHGHLYRCAYDEEAFLVVNDAGRVLATASTLAGAELACRTLVEEGQAERCCVRATLRKDPEVPGSARRVMGTRHRQGR